jgi:hypothetical protein
MARTNVPVTSLALDAKVDAPAAVVIVHASGATIAAGGDTRKLLVVLTNTTAAEKIMTIKAPTTNPNAVRSGIGDLAITFAAGNVTAQVKYVVLESARFAQADGSISIDFAADTTGFMNAYRLP